MSYTFDSMLKEATALPWAMGARLMVELRSTVKIPEQPVFTKEAARGMVKIARIVKYADDEAGARKQLEHAAATDPDVVQAMDFQQAQAERESLMAKVQELQMATEAAQAQAMQADQQAQQATQQSEQMVAQMQQSKQEQINAVMESMQAKDQVLQTQVSSQQHRQQIAGYAQQMADQLKQIASTSPEEQQMQQQQAAADQQAQTQQAQAQADQASQQAVQGGAPPKAKTKKEQQEAQTSQQKAQEQSIQAEQAAQQEQAEQQQQASMQPQPPGMPPKMGSAKEKVAHQLKLARIRRQLEKRAQFSETQAGYGEGSEGSGQQGMFRYSSLGKRGQGFFPGSSGLGADQGESGAQGGMNQYASMGGKPAVEKQRRLPAKKVKTASGNARAIGEELGVDWDHADYTPEDLAKGMEIEKEHHKPGVDVMAHEEVPQKTAKIALAHLKERGDYYDLLEPRVEEAPGDKISESKEKTGSFSKEQAAAIAQRVRLIKEGQLKKGSWGSADSSESHIKEAAEESVVKNTLKGLGRTGIYAGIGAALGAGAEHARLRSHTKKYGLDQPTDRELNLAGKVLSAQEKVNRDPSYVNKLTVTNLKYKLDTERLSREHPNNAAIRGAAWGAGAGMALGPVTHRLLAKVIKRGK